MRNYIIRRILIGIFICFVVSLIVFSLLYLMPGDVAQSMLGLEATEEQLQKLRLELGLDQPLLIQYGRWISNFFRGELGTSVMYNLSVKHLIGQRFPITLYLGGLALIIGNLAGILLGVIAAYKRGSFWDSLITTVASFGISIPRFWLAILLILVFGLYLGWLPIFGYTSPFVDYGLSVRQLILPVFVLALLPAATTCRRTRSAMLEVIEQDYMRTARSKGLTEKAILIRHGLKNAMIPVITLIFMSVGRMASGAVLVETVFSIPGMGRLTVNAASNKDMAVLQMCVMMIAIMVVLANLAADIMYCWLDPRIRYD